MKIMKNILIPIVLFISLFFNTSKIFAANNLNTTFNANNDELTVTVKNNSDKELSDVEYNLNLPSEYTAKYEVNPNYSLSPQEETTFKVKVSKSGDNVSNKGEQGTKTFTSSKKSLDNTGLTSELTVGAIVVLFLLVGVLLYFKQRKVFIILLVAGIGTQLFPRYSFAADKIRQTENFKEHVTLLENNIPVSLDVSYLIEGDSNNIGNNSGNNGNSTNNNGNNSGNNGLNPNDKDPKEIVLAGYAYSGKTNNILEEKELKIFDGDKEITTVKTDAEGYFFTHLIQDKTYTIKGEDFEVTVTMKASGLHEYKEYEGKLILGKILQDEYSKIKVKPDVIVVGEDIEYKIEKDEIIINSILDIKEGDKVVIAPSHILPRGKSVKVLGVSKSSKETTIRVIDIDDFFEIIEDFKYKKDIDLSELQITPMDNFKLNEDKSNNRSANVFSRKVSGTLNTGNLELGVELEGSLGVDANLNIFGDKKLVVSSQISTEVSLGYEFANSEKNKDKAKAKGKNSDELTIAAVTLISPAGVSLDGFLVLVLENNGKGKVSFKSKTESKVRIGYDKGAVFDKKASNQMSVDISGEFEHYSGIGIVPNIRVVGLSAMKFKVSAGPQWNVKGSLSYDFPFGNSEESTNFLDNKKLNTDEKKEGNIKVNLSGEVSRVLVRAEFSIPPINFKLSDEVKFLTLKFEHDFSLDNGGKDGGKDDGKDGDKDKENDEKLKPYRRVFEDFKKIREYKDDLQKLSTTVKLNEYWNSWVIEEVAESKEVSYTLYDINNDGVDELLISNNKGNNLISSFYLDNGNPRLLVEDYVAKHGGWRAASNFYKDGSIMHRTWSSGTGKGKAHLYKFINGNLTKIKTINIDNIFEFEPKNIGVSEKSELNLSSLQWKPIKAN